MFICRRPSIISLARTSQVLGNNAAVLKRCREVNSRGSYQPADQRLFCSDSSDDTHAFQNIYGSLRRPKAKPKKIPTKDRRVPVSLSLSMKYLESQTYKNTYGDFKVWQMYRRNFGGPHEYVPLQTRRSCVGDDGYINTNNPCPICRDKYLLLDYRNIMLLKQFIDPYTDELLSLQRSNLCQVKYEELMTEYIKAKDYGTITFTLPQRDYNYEEYYHKDLLKEWQSSSEESTEDIVMKKISLYPDYVHEDPAPYQFPNILPEKLLE